MFRGLAVLIGDHHGGSLSGFARVSACGSVCGGVRSRVCCSCVCQAGILTGLGGCDLPEDRSGQRIGICDVQGPAATNGKAVGGRNAPILATDTAEDGVDASVWQDQFRPGVGIDADRRCGGAVGADGHAVQSDGDRLAGVPDQDGLGSLSRGGNCHVSGNSQYAVGKAVAAFRAGYVEIAGVGFSRSEGGSGKHAGAKGQRHNQDEQAMNRSSHCIPFLSFRALHRSPASRSRETEPDLRPDRLYAFRSAPFLQDPAGS